MKKSFESFRYAMKGLQYFFLNERNGKIQLLAAIAVAMMGVMFRISPQEWMWVVVCIATVLSFEMMNTAVEKMCDMIEPAIHPSIKVIKDVAAAAVLLVAILSVTIAAIIFLPKILDLI